VKNHLKTIAEKENVNADDDALHIIAQKADGAMRDALSIFDRVVSFSGSELTRKAVTENLNVLDYDEFFNITDLLLENNIPQVLIKFNEIISKGFDGHHFISGLASHFRDLLVAKDKATIPLLEVGDNAKKKYLEQSEKATMQFLLKGIDKANDCDLKYKTSRNQRLLVELVLMQIASITFDGEKKNDENYIIPAKFFRNIVVEEKIDVKIIPVKETLEKTLVEGKPVEKVIESVKLDLTKTSGSRKRNSTFSLKSVERKKEVNDIDVEVIDYSSMPQTPFTEIEFLKLWNQHYKDLLKDGKKIIASIFKADLPKLEGVIIHLVLPNENMKSQLITHKPKLLKFLRTKLNNYSIDLHIDVNEVVEKKYAYTPQEKYEKLKEKNPFIAEFRKKLDLDV
jgi:DNA polymerase-3 subunit gamma/tau